MSVQNEVALEMSQAEPESTMTAIAPEYDLQPDASEKAEPCKASPPAEREPESPTRPYTLAAVVVLIVATIATAASWRMYPLFIDTYYHMAVIEGFSQAGGVTTWAFWEMAPGGRVHIYPPSLHIIGYFFNLLGVSPGTYMTLVSASFYTGCLATTWFWLRRIIGPRSALFAVVLLCGPQPFFWTQATFQAAAGVMMLAPLALLALEKERFLACGVVNLITITMHPMGLFLPPALVINTLLRNKKIVAGLLAAALPVVLYGPWLAHIWANRAYLPDNRTGSEISLGGVGGGPNLGLFLAPLAVVGLLWLCKRGGTALGLVGALVGFAVVVPMGFGSRFLAFNIHWPLACLAAYGLGELLGWLEKRPRLRTAAQLATAVVLVVALVAYPAINVSLGGLLRGRGPGGPPREANRDRLGDETLIANWQFSIQSSALAQLFAAYSGQGGGMGMGGPGMGGPPGGGPGGMGGPPGMGGRQGMMLGGPGMGPGGPPADMDWPAAEMDGQDRPRSSSPWWLEGGDPSREERADGEKLPAEPERDGNSGERRRRERGGMVAGGRAGGGGGMGGGNRLRGAGAEEFFDAVRGMVKTGDLIYMQDGAGANLITGATGGWTTGGILRDVRSESGHAGPEECDFAVTLGGGMGMPGPGGPMGSQELTEDFEKLFENEYGTLYRNTAAPKHDRRPLAADVSLAMLAAIAAVCAALVLIDLVPVSRWYFRPVAAAVGVVVVALCLVPLTSKAIGELRDPPSAPAWEWDRPPGFGGPGFGPGQFPGRERSDERSDEGRRGDESGGE